MYWYSEISSKTGRGTFFSSAHFTPDSFQLGVYNSASFSLTDRHLNPGSSISKYTSWKTHNFHCCEVFFFCCWKNNVDVHECKRDLNSSFLKLWPSKLRPCLSVCGGWLAVDLITSHSGK